MRPLAHCFHPNPAVKLGQHIGMLDHLVPEEYVRAMKAHMLNRCPVSDWSQVRAVVREDLGAEPGALFASFSPTPLASASLAQVHEACTHDGRRVAVKVRAGLAVVVAVREGPALQHPGPGRDWHELQKLTKPTPLPTPALNSSNCRRCSTAVSESPSPWTWRR